MGSQIGEKKQKQKQNKTKQNKTNKQTNHKKKEEEEEEKKKKKKKNKTMNGNKSEVGQTNLQPRFLIAVYENKPKTLDT